MCRAWCMQYLCYLSIPIGGTVSTYSCSCVFSRASQTPANHMIVLRATATRTNNLLIINLRRHRLTVIQVIKLIYSNITIAHFIYNSQCDTIGLTASSTRYICNTDIYSHLQTLTRYDSESVVFRQTTMGQAAY